jgi:PAS domain S-box-containing protein
LAVLGYDRSDELLGRSPLDFVRADERAAAGGRMHATYERGVVQPEIERRLVKKDGSELAAEVISIPIVFDGAPSTLVQRAYNLGLRCVK